MSAELRMVWRAVMGGAGFASVLALLAGVLAGSWVAGAAVLIVIAVAAAVVGVLTWHRPLLEVEPQHEIPRPAEAPARDTLL